MLSSKIRHKKLTIDSAIQQNAVLQWKFPLNMHGAGCYTLQPFLKYINPKNELLAHAAERVSVVANNLKAAPYPKEKLNEAWTSFRWHKLHDDITGTSIRCCFF